MARALVERLEAKARAYRTGNGLENGITMGPVVTERQRVDPWWARAATARLMVSEYLKYVFAKLRMGLNPAAQASEAS